MHTITRGVVGLALLTAAAIGLAGCSTATTAPGTGRTQTVPPTPSRSATESASTVDFGEAPERAQAPGCSTLLPMDLVGALVPGATITDPLASAEHVNGSWSSLAVAGGTECWATNGVSSIDDVLPGTHDDPVFQGVVVSVLPRAAAAFDAAQSDASALQGDAAGPACNASDAARVYCAGSVLAQNAWVTVDVTRVQDSTDATPEAMLPTYQELVERVRAAVATSAAGTQTGDDSPDGSLTECSADRVNAVTSTRLRSAWAQTDMLPWLREFAQTRVAAAHCVFSAGESYAMDDALYSTTPRAGWFVEQRLAAGLIDRAGRIDLPGLGERDGAWRTCDASACTIDVVHDGAWTQYFLHSRVAPNTSSAVERWAESSFSA